MWLFHVKIVRYKSAQSSLGVRKANRKKCFYIFSNNKDENEHFFQNKYIYIYMYTQNKYIYVYIYTHTHTYIFKLNLITSAQQPS